MAMIDPEGLYFGDRMARLSTMARLHWPYIFLLSNGSGRFEISYPKIVSRAYATFTPIPPSAEVGVYIREYRDAFLLFIYKSRGQVWGQWDTSEKYLPRYKDAEAQNSPQPPQDELNRWREGYIASKLNDNAVSDSTFNVFRNFSLDLREVCCGEGVGVGVGVGKNLSSKTGPVEALAGSEVKNGLSAGPRVGTLELLKQQWFDNEFWPNIWRKVDKAEALKVFKKKATSEEAKNKIMAAVKSHFPVYMGRTPEHRPHASTWLNKQRFDDEFPEDPRNGNSTYQADTLTERLSKL